MSINECREIIRSGCNVQSKMEDLKEVTKRMVQDRKLYWEWHDKEKK